jgi:hypothetical protein
MPAPKLEPPKLDPPRLEPANDLAADERWQLVQRIVSSPPFQKSVRLRELLEYVAKRTIRGHAHELSEQHIGNALFHKPSGYSSLEDSSVRVHIRQLRLKLHEYFDEEGREEPLVLTIPKGGYAPVFKAAAKSAELEAETKVVPGGIWRRRTFLAWALCGVLTVICAALLYQSTRNRVPGGSPIAAPPWPFSQVFDSRHQTLIVVADSNYGMYRIFTSQPGSLDQYLRRDFLQNSFMPKREGPTPRLSEYISNSMLTSFADVVNVATLVKMAGPFQEQALLRHPRDLSMRDMDHDNYVFIGSQGSNPWVSLFQNRLNFRESEGIVGNSAKAFVNTNPRPGERARYEGLRWTGTIGEDYATIALLPNVTHDGSVLIMQGLQQEGTEAAGRFLAEAENRQQLKAALGITGSTENSLENTWFEALIHSRTVAGAPNSTNLVAVRRIQ